MNTSGGVYIIIVIDVRVYIAWICIISDCVHMCIIIILYLLQNTRKANRRLDYLIRIICTIVENQAIQDELNALVRVCMCMCVCCVYVCVVCMYVVCMWGEIFTNSLLYV